MKQTPTRIRHDYKAVLDSPGPTRTRRLPWLAVALTVALGVAALLLVPFGDASIQHSGHPRLVQTESAVIAAKVTPVIADTRAPTVGATTRSISLALPAKEQTPAGPVHNGPSTTGEPQNAASGDAEQALTIVRRAAAQPVTVPTSGNDAVIQRAATQNAMRKRVALALPRPSILNVETVPDPDEDAAQVELVIASGDTLDGLFGKHGLSRADLIRILRLPGAERHLQLLKPGDRIGVQHENGNVLGLTRALDEERTLQITRDAEGFATEIVFNPVERRVAHGQGTIDSSLFRAAQQAGISDTLIMELAGVFAWDIDFVLDIRRGDRFVVLYEELWQDGEKLRDGEILAAEFINAGEQFRAVRFTDPDGNVGYFTPDGHNVKKAFLRAPIAITPRVTSNFNPRRLHPVHKKVRPHRGVDYGAPSGTPIKAAGDGKVIFRGRKGGYGNAVILQHGGNITTLYAHMSRFHKRSRVGHRVRQGEVIGYVGATGTVTAAHLHYEYRVGGVHRNPRTVKLPKAQPVPRQHRDAFAAATRPMLQRLDLIQRSIRLADNSAAIQ